jgi:hypothetical protein
MRACIHDYMVVSWNHRGGTRCPHCVLLERFAKLEAKLASHRVARAPKAKGPPKAPQEDGGLFGTGLGQAIGDMVNKVQGYTWLCA